MNECFDISTAIGNINDRFILEAYEYKSHTVVYKNLWRMGIMAASICLVIGAAVWINQEHQFSAMVYASDSNLKMTIGKTILLPGQIDDNGKMNGHPLMFYILGDDIESIRFSCKNEWISFVDWTEQRGDFGLGKNFTVPYGEREEDYYYLVVDWVPQNIIRKLTDNKDVGIENLQPEEKEDIIILEITYLDGRCETLSMNIKLNSKGQFMVVVSNYEITDNDDFVFRPDSQPIEHQP